MWTLFMSVYNRPTTKHRDITYIELDNTTKRNTKQRKKNASKNFYKRAEAIKTR